MLLSSRRKVVVVFTTFKLVTLLQEAGGPVNTDNWGGTRHLASAPKISPFLSARHRIVSSRFVYRWPEIALTSLISGRGVGARVGRSSVPPWEAHLATFSRFHLLHLGPALYLQPAPSSAPDFTQVQVHLDSDRKAGPRCSL